jgi:hypothetical protein
MSLLRGTYVVEVSMSLEITSAVYSPECAPKLNVPCESMSREGTIDVAGCAR